jgi:hypothetical protein
MAAGIGVCCYVTVLVKLAWVFMLLLAAWIVMRALPKTEAAACGLPIAATFVLVGIFLVCGFQYLAATLKQDGRHFWLKAAGWLCLPLAGLAVPWIIGMHYSYVYYTCIAWMVVFLGTMLWVIVLPGVSRMIRGVCLLPAFVLVYYAFILMAISGRSHSTW